MTDIDIIDKYLLRKKPVELNYELEEENSFNKCFFLACCFETDVSKINDIIKLGNINVRRKNYNGNNGFLFACWLNKNIEVINFFVNDLKMDCNETNNFNENGFTMACRFNNLNIIEFLVYDLKIDINPNSLRSFRYAQFTSFTISIRNG